ncbi:MAG TPA: FKBP-type peptidyl-prolyl cis-trans isomerase [Myxococcota bacterium]|jgi:FKBP-type peptidyl-prolyl cis-trans isomerase FkpA/FKBP-type peptidyl-prolyl cis-trans isomerase FklB
MNATSNPLRLALISFAMLGWLACEQKAAEPSGAAPGAAAPQAGELATDDQKTIYALGLALARELEPFSLSEAEIGTLELGLRDGVLGAPPKVDLETQGPQIQTLAKARLGVAAAEEAKASEEFLATAAAAPGAQKLESGLIYLEVAPGTGPSPKATDTVKVHYHGTVRDGSVFDSSVDRGTPAQFPLDRVIPCWTEGVQKMKVGGKSKLTCPAAIAYADRGAPPKIKPGAALAFEVELIEIVPAATGALPPGHPPAGGGAPPGS